MNEFKRPAGGGKLARVGETGLVLGVKDFSCSKRRPTSAGGSACAMSN